MTIVLNENDWADEMILNRTLGKKPFETLRRVARRYLDGGYAKKDVRRMLDTFLLQCDPGASLPRWSNALDGALNAAVKYPAIRIDSVCVTRAETETIDALEQVQARRLAFTLLCLAKYWGLVNGTDPGWVNCRDSDIMRMANINTSVRRQSALFRLLNEAGLISFSRKVDNTNVRVLFCRDGETAMRITDFRNLGYQYMLAHGGPFFVCENCGVTARITGGTQARRLKYCPECAHRIKLQQTVNSVMRSREDTGAERAARRKAESENV